MADEVFTGSLDELRDSLLEIWRLTGAGAKAGWLTHIDFFPSASIDECWKPSSSPGDMEWIIAADNFSKVLDGWRWLLRSAVWREVPGVFPAITLQMIDDATSLQRFGAGTSARAGRFDSALADLAEGMRLAKSAVDGQAKHLLAAIRIAGDEGLEAVAKHASPTASPTDRERWGFARPLRAKSVKWKLIAEQWRKKTGEPVGDKAFEISCGRAKSAEATDDER